MIQVSGAGHARKLDHELPLMPFIDFMLCLLAFLMMTAIWSQMARLKAAADGPGQSGEDAHRPRPTLHVTVRDKSFDLAWREASTVIDTRKLPRAPLANSERTARYPELSRVMREEWERRGVHRAASDPEQDRAVLHTSNALSFDEVVAVMDAMNAAKRTSAGGNAGSAEAAFAVSFATD
ncbi:MAG TPA: biopolymer transporter ExbD [Polyangiaceae bacterium]|nr:biopolymer transporter ExbD [Polyangiaceae bacterium]